MTAENRAWIKIEVSKHYDWQLIHDVYLFTVDVELTNVGKGIARLVKVEAVLLATDGEFSDSNAGVGRFAESFSRHKGGEQAVNLFPEECRTWQISADITVGDIQGLKNRLEGTAPTNLCLIARYWTVFDDPNGPPRQTCAVFAVRRIAASGFTLLPDDRSVPANEIALQHPWNDAGFVT
jgi:hypothetical protein